ncbi:MAG: radical SAM protein, partial [candidate division Zixibacteria bacterium]|nr:radical SAM protein [candidate division Zixibacteria bacterium]
IIPKVRGKLINRPASEIIEEINLLSKNGYHEVVLTGVHIGQYGWDKVKSIADLTRYILDNTNISRLRLSSIEPQEVNSDIVSVIKNGGRRVCRYLHIPLQSGSDRILKMMHRPYSINDYINKLRSVKESIDGIIIGADIIVGFPGESENDFNESVKIAKSGAIDYLHVFSYSDRPGTESSVMPDKVSSKVIKKRSKILRDISDINYKSALQKEIGKTVYAVSESGTNKSGKHYWGITDNFLKIILPEKLGGDREIIKLKVTGAKDKYLIGTF